MGWTLVTGAAKGLGREICLQLAAHKHDVLIHYNTSEQDAIILREKCLNMGIQAELIQGDLSSPELIIDFIGRLKSKFPRISSLVNNVGNFINTTALNTSSEDWLDLFYTNVHAPVAIVQSVVESIIEDQGSIVNIGFAGLNAGIATAGSSAYRATKEALFSFTKSLALELAPKGVSVNMVSPGYMVNSVEFPPKLSDIPVGRAAALEEVARVVLFLLNKEQKYTTGQNIEVAGGIGLS